jgi:tetratricopeptide (TPR) repeat protein
MTPVIYTIAKNEALNVEGFMRAAQGAPVYVLDTGSADNTVELLQEHGAHVTQKVIDPWRFDRAREAALALVPDQPDILCVSIDMDERLEDGWQDKLAAEWVQGCNFGNYRYIGEWRDAEQTVPAVESARTRLHARQGFHWERPVHEIPVADATTRVRSCDTSVLVRHYSNGEQRNYAPLLTTILEANPNDADARLQRGGEFAQKGEWDNALVDYHAWLRISYGDDRPVIRYRRATTHISCAVCYYNLGQHGRALRSFWEAVAAEPICREAWVNLAHTYQAMGDPVMALACAQKALAIVQPPYYACIDSFCWSDFPEKLAHELRATLKEIL